MVYAIGVSLAYAKGNTPVLTVLNWADYIDPSVVAAFEEQYNVKVNDVYYETDDERDKFVTQTAGVGYDVGIVSGIMVDTYKNKGWIDSISLHDVPNLQYIDKEKRGSNEGADGFSVPYAWGTMGIAYRTDLVEKPIESWMDLFQPQKSLHGKIVMIKSSRELLGGSFKCERLLRQQYE